MVLNKQLKTGDSILSMRALARDLKVSVVTVQKAYENLQKDGFIETIHGKGSYISARNIDSYKKDGYRELEILAKEIIEHININSISLDELMKLLTEIYTEGRNIFEK